MSDKKIFFCGKDGVDNGAWAELYSLKQVRDFFKDNAHVAPHLPKKAFKTLRVMRCYGPNDDASRIYIWGEKQPGFSEGDVYPHVGTFVEIDGKVVYNDLKPGDDDDIADHEDCDECAK